MGPSLDVSAGSVAGVRAMPTARGARQSVAVPRYHGRARPELTEPSSRSTPPRGQALPAKMGPKLIARVVIGDTAIATEVWVECAGDLQSVQPP